MTTNKAKRQEVGPIKVRLLRPMDGQMTAYMYLRTEVYSDIVTRLKSAEPEEEIHRYIVEQYGYNRRVIEGIREFAGV